MESKESKEKPFVTHVLRGPRFDDHTIPVEVLPEFEAYQALVVEVAKALFFTRNPKRKRVPKKFVDGFGLALKRVGGDCVATELQRRPIAAARGELFEPKSDEFEAARDAIARCVEAAANGNRAPDEFPHELIARFNEFGKRLLEGESIELRAPGVATGVKYDARVRKALVLQVQADYQQECEVIGSVVEANVEDRLLTLRLDDGRPVKARFDAAMERVVTRALSQHARKRVRIAGMGVFDSRDALQRILETHAITLIHDGPKTTLVDRMAQLRQLADGWMDGQGKAPPPAGLDWLAAILSDLVENDLPLPYLYPTLEGDVQAEWSFEDWEVSATFGLVTKKVELLAAHTKTDACPEESIDLASPEGPDRLVDFVSQYVPRD